VVFIIKDQKMELFEDFDEIEGLPRIKNMPDIRPRSPWRDPINKRKKTSQSDIQASLKGQKDEVGDYAFTYDASRHEREWIVNSLGLFYEMQWFADILRLVKGGKEASVYQCLTSSDSPVNGRFVAAKVYRPRRFRNLRNDYIYREGREYLNDAGNPIIRDKKLKAVNQRSAYGRQVMHTSWLEHEYKTLQILHAAGADVPKPYASGTNAILMDFIGDAEMAAPTLNQVDLDQAEAHLLFERVLDNIEIMLANERVHADLSAFNILYWGGEIMLIDFPQAISPLENQNAFLIFERDLRRVCEYFIRQGVVVDYRDLAVKLWRKYKYRRTPEFNLGLLDEEDEGDRAYWDKTKDSH
jgi:RIO kinase 1